MTENGFSIIMQLSVTRNKRQTDRKGCNVEGEHSYCALLCHLLWMAGRRLATTLVNTPSRQTGYTALMYAAALGQECQMDALLAYDK